MYRGSGSFPIRYPGEWEPGPRSARSVASYPYGRLEAPWSFYSLVDVGWPDIITGGYGVVNQCEHSQTLHSQDRIEQLGSYGPHVARINNNLVLRVFAVATLDWDFAMLPQLNAGIPD